MIYVDRETAPVPKFFGSTAYRKLQASLEEHFGFGKDRRQERIFAMHVIAKEANRGLIALFHGKCAYCESPLSDAGPGDIENFRPKLLRGDDRHRDHYWWLAY